MSRFAFGSKDGCCDVGFAHQLFWLETRWWDWSRGNGHVRQIWNCVTQGKSSSCYSIETWFTAHGLWPSNTNGGSLKPQWNDQNWKTKFTPIPEKQAEELAPYWMNYNKLDGRDNVKVWQYEWDKHGENGHFSQDKYFKKGIELTQTYGRRLVQILAEEGIIPSDEVQYNVLDIEVAIFKGLGWVKPELACEKGKVTGFYVLSEIRLLFDISAQHLRNATLKKCKEQLIYFPSAERFSNRNTEL